MIVLYFWKLSLKIVHFATYLSLFILQVLTDKWFYKFINNFKIYFWSIDHLYSFLIYFFKKVIFQHDFLVPL